jgi:DNA-binding transcriptional MerR regulator
MKRDQKTLPPIPDKHYFNISETANLCGVSQHVLRYWEQEFPELNPVKGESGRRCYQHKDVLVARRIRDLLYNKQFTIKGAKKQLRVDKMDKSVKAIPSEVPVQKGSTEKVFQEVITSLQSLLKAVKS